MADLRYVKGIAAALPYLLVDGADVRGMLVMTGFTGESEEDAETLADITTVDEYDGLGYQQLDVENWAGAYDDSSDEWRWDFDAGAFNAAGGTVDAGSDDWTGILWYLYTGATDAEKYVLWFEDLSDATGVGTAVTYTPHADGPFYFDG